MVKKCYAITVYRDTVDQYNDYGNLMEIVIEKEDLEEWLSAERYTFDLDDFLSNYTADDTINLYDFLAGKGKDVFVLG